jgi:hypothetical protein
MKSMKLKDSQIMSISRYNVTAMDNNRGLNQLVVAFNKSQQSLEKLVHSFMKKHCL